jgi:phospholipase/carboxylesterase
MDLKPELIEFKGWTLRLYRPERPGPHPVIFLLHGWTGDENVMWVFASRLPKHYLMVAPRGLFASPLGGFGWNAHNQGAWPELNDFQPAVDGILELSANLQTALEQEVNQPFLADFSHLSLVGFSQGAALAYAFALLHSDRVARLASLAGFMPEGVESLLEKRVLTGKPVFVAHGARDETVPVERARQAVKNLQQAGALVTYCEGNAGHKLDAACFRGLAEFYRANSLPRLSTSG